MLDSPEVAAALQSSKFNEIVSVTSDIDGSTQEALLILCLDESNGGVIWQKLKEWDCTKAFHPDSNKKDDAHDVAIERHLRTKRWFFPMLNDHVRNTMYSQAIRAACQDLVQQHQNSKTIRVLDIGTGTGLLSMMAAQYLQEATETANSKNEDSNYMGCHVDIDIHVTSLEMASAMSRLARLTIADNNLQDKISILEQHSTDENALFEPPNSYQLCVSELLESSLLAEGMLPAIRDAWERHLTLDAVMVPQYARVYGQLVEGPALEEYWGPHNRSDSDLKLSLSTNPADLMLEGGSRGGFVLHIHANHWVSTSAQRKRMNNHQLCYMQNQEEDWKLKPLSDPCELISFDFSRSKKLPGPRGRQTTHTVTPHTSGNVHGILFWWELDLYKGDNTDKEDMTYSTQPGKQPWQDHWHQNLFIFTNCQSKAIDNKNPCSLRVAAGDACELLVKHDDTSFWFSVTNNTDGNGPESKRIKVQQVGEASNSVVVATMQQSPPSGQMQPHVCCISPLRAWQLNDSRRMDWLRRCISTALEKKGQDTVVLDVSDFSLCAMLAALEGATRVSSLESSSQDLPTVSAKVAQLANGLPRVVTSKKKANENPVFQILQCHAEQLSLEVINGSASGPSLLERVEILVAEPYYQVLEGWHIQEALNFFYLARSLLRREILSETAIAVPSYAIIKGCAICSSNLHSAYSSCDTSICGFDHSKTNIFGDRFHTYDLALPMWEYDYEDLTEPFEMGKLEYDAKHLLKGQAPKSTRVRVPFHREGTCHGMLIWVEYRNQSEVATHSTLGRGYHQLVRLLSVPFPLDEKNYFHYEFVCDLHLGGQKDFESYQIMPRVEKI